MNHLCQATCVPLCKFGDERFFLNRWGKNEYMSIYVIILRISSGGRCLVCKSLGTDALCFMQVYDEVVRRGWPLREDVQGLYMISRETSRMSKK